MSPVPPKRIFLEDDTPVTGTNPFPVTIASWEFDGEYGVTIDLVHHKVHEGDAYLVSGVDVIAAGTAASFKGVIRTPDTSTQYHIQMEALGTSGFRATFYEGATTSTLGTTQTTYNLNRRSANTTLLTFETDPTMSSRGTMLQTRHIGGDVRGTVGGEARQGLEWILGQNETYLVELVSDAASNTVSFEAIWYEN